MVLTIPVLDLPTSLVCVILRDWLDLRSICRLDTSFCDHPSRKALHSIFASDELIINIEPDLDFDVLVWVARRYLKFPGYVVTDEEVWTDPERVRSTFTHIGTHAWNLTLAKMSNQENFNVSLISSYFKRLKSLCLREMYEDGDSIAMMVLNNASTLETLSMRVSTLPERYSDGSDVVLAEGSLPALRRLDIEDPHSTSASTVQRLLHAATALLSVRFLGFPLTDDCIRGIQRHSTTLTALWLNETSEFTLSVLHEALRSLVVLRELDLGNCPIPTDDTIETAVVHCTQLRALALAESVNLTDRSLTLIAQHCGTRLECLEIGAQHITDVGVDAIGKYCTNMVGLRLTRTDSDNFSDAAVSRLFERCTCLTELDVGDCQLTSAILTQISRKLPALVFLNVFYAQEEECVEGLADVLLNCKELRKLAIAETSLSWTALTFRMLATLRPGLVITHQCESVPYWFRHVKPGSL
jgi:hypothetical protein